MTQQIFTPTSCANLWLTTHLMQESKDLSIFLSFHLLLSQGFVQGKILKKLKKKKNVDIHRFDMHRYAREAWSMGVRYIGGCCGFQPYHIRACAEELAVERKKSPEGSEKHLPWGGGLTMHTKPWVRARARRDYWENMKPAGGRPYCPVTSSL